METGRDISSINARIDRLPSWGLGLIGYLIFGVSFFFSFYDIGVIGFALPGASQTLHLTSGNISLIVSLNLAGYIIGAFALGTLSDYFGRRFGLRIMLVILALGALLTAFSWSPGSLILFRLIAGIGIGSQIALVSTYVSELSPAARRGRILQYVLVGAGIGFTTVGLLGGLWLAVIPGTGWRILLGLGAVLALLLPLTRAKWLPESPRWLATHGRLSEAEGIVSMMETKLESAGYNLPEPASVPSDLSAERFPTRELMHKPYLSRLVVALSYWFLRYIWVYGFLAFEPTLFKALGISLAKSFSYAALGDIAPILATILPIFVIDRFERKYVVAANDLLGVAGLVLIFVGAPNNSALIILGAFLASWAASGGALAYTYTAEIFPTRARATGMAISDGVGHLGGVVSPYIVLALISSVTALYTFPALAGFAFLGMAAIFFGGIRTSRRGLTELSATPESIGGPDATRTSYRDSTEAKRA